MEATRLTDQLIDEARSLGRDEKLRLLQLLVGELAVDTSVSETVVSSSNAAAVDALHQMLRETANSE